MRTLVVAFVIIAWLALPASAQLSTGTQPAPGASTLWIHRNVEASTYWLSNVKAEAAHDDPDPGYNVLGIGGGAVPPNPDHAGSFRWDIPMDPTLQVPLTFESGGTIDFAVYMRTTASPPQAGTLAGAPGTGDLTVTLLAGEAVIAEATQAEVQFDGTFQEFLFSVAPAVPTVTSGNLHLQIVMAGAAGGCLLGASDDNGWTSVTLPLPAGSGGGPGPGGATGPLYQELNGTTVALKVSPPTGTSRVHVYNWTTELTKASVRATANATAGAATVKILDGAGATVMDSRLNATRSEVQLNATVAPGNWQIQVAFASFTGDFELRIQEPAAAGQTTTGGSSTSGTVGSTSGSSSASSTGTSEETPGPGWLAAMALLAVAVVVRRRLAA